jgi:[acyl-carrier-protein] S-malonyltransferase
MNRCAFVFPGQGAQYVGMAMDFVEAYPEYGNVLKRFHAKAGVDLLDIMKNGPEDKLKDTKFTQPAILFHSVVAMQTLKKELDIKPEMVAGHSLGEFSALVANGSLDFNDALYLVHKRGEFMIKANEDTPFAMAAIIGLESSLVDSICKQASQSGIVVAANFNTPEQTVISGCKDGVEHANLLAEEAGAKRIIPLTVGGPFHSPLIRRAEDWLAEEMEAIRFNPPEVPVICNVSAKAETDPDMIKQNLIKQITSSVRWVESVQHLLNEGIDTFFEFGPKKVIAGMIKKIDRKATILNVDKVDDIEKVIEKVRDV